MDKIRTYLAFHSIKEGILILDGYSTVLYSNKAMNEILEVRDQHEIETKLEEILIEGIALVEHLQMNKIAYFREHKFKSRYNGSTGLTVIRARDIRLELMNADKDEAINKFSFELEEAKRLIFELE